MDGSRNPCCPVELRPGAELGRTRFEGLSGRHHFSFATYQRLDRLEWGFLRAVNHYRLEPGATRAPTFHADFEILTLVTSGLLQRNGTHAPRQPLCPGSAELISTGRGANLGVQTVGPAPASYVEIWIKSATQRRSRREYRESILQGLDRPLASPAPSRSPTLRWGAQAQVHYASLGSGQTADLMMGESDCAYLVVLGGGISANGVAAGLQDGMAIAGPGVLALRALSPGDFILVRTQRSAPPQG